VAHHRDPGRVEVAGHLADGAAGLILDDVQDAPPRPVAEGVEDRTHVVHM
jgi:hypothetical protein